MKDDGEILGVQPDCIDQMKKDFVTSINNENKMYPPLYLTPVEHEHDGRAILYIRVPTPRASADAAAEFMTVLTNPISTSQIILMKYIGFMQGETDHIL